MEVAEVAVLYGYKKKSIVENRGFGLDRDLRRRTRKISTCAHRTGLGAYEMQQRCAVRLCMLWNDRNSKDGDAFVAE